MSTLSTSRKDGSMESAGEANEADSVAARDALVSPPRALPPGTMESALGKFKAGAASFDSLIRELVAATEAERKGLEEQRLALEEERACWELERQRMQTVLSSAEQVTLNVGGLKFTTSVNTLRNAPNPSLFTAMFSGRHKLTKDSEGCYFIDRDGRHFHDILNYLRDGSFHFPGPSGPGADPAAASTSAAAPAGPFAGGPGGWPAYPPPIEKYLLELRAEANYYGLTGLMAAIDRYPHGLVRVARAAALNTDDSWMYEDGQDEVVMGVDKPVQLLGVGLCGTEGGLTVELELYEVDPEDFSRELATCASCAQSFTKADGTILRLMLPDPVTLLPGKTYMLSALIKGAESYCCEECLETVIAGGVTVHFHPWESPNGTSEHRGQFPELYIRVV
ncbi:hypothetical protein HYH03_004775 [Edaphochlamys debaryana]|uniref:BTB domain-containing protein n=1 Tax=Edaphochlamys debaryana TaxID=47281 RepID=A0A836C1Q8_9CHLO|nr:hypothetical protein HYH03_004775 [Edaphochlamys debaryana]|eukprot:KAG2497186.1 hypothetical protein HYH03_004775 [Edaphochlamys debaryana]